MVPLVSLNSNDPLTGDPVLTKDRAQGIGRLAECCARQECCFQLREQIVGAARGRLDTGERGGDALAILPLLIFGDPCHLPLNGGEIEAMRRYGGCFILDMDIDTDNPVITRFSRQFELVGIVRDRVLHEPALDRRDRAPLLLHLR